MEEAKKDAGISFDDLIMIDVLHFLSVGFRKHSVGGGRIVDTLVLLDLHIGWRVFGLGCLEFMRYMVGKLVGEIYNM